MRTEPAAAELLKVARQALLEEILPQVPEGARYTARMVANAMAIAMRAAEGVDRAHAAELARAREDDARLAGEIRAGRVDIESRALIESLRRVTAERLAVSNPRILDNGKPT